MILKINNLKRIIYLYLKLSFYLFLSSAYLKLDRAIFGLDILDLKYFHEVLPCIGRFNFLFLAKLEVPEDWIGIIMLTHASAK